MQQPACTQKVEGVGRQPAARRLAPCRAPRSLSPRLLAVRFFAAWSLIAWFVAAWVLAALAAATPARAAEPNPEPNREPILTDRNTGLAIWGYDPIAFFLDGRAEPGEARYELPYGGATWRFANAGNLAAFEQDPRIYLPTFGGYDPTFAARHAAVPGNPEIFAIWNNRLFLFRDEASRERFLTDPPTAFRAAEAGWPESAAAIVR